VTSECQLGWADRGTACGGRYGRLGRAPSHLLSERQRVELTDYGPRSGGVKTYAARPSA